MSKPNWRPIEEAEKSGYIIAWASGWGEPGLLVWKTNDRIVGEHKHGRLLDHLASYWGDPIEYDDYDLAKAENAPTHFLPYLPFPA